MERTFQAPAQAVFDAWTSEEVMRRWWHAEHDWETTEAEVDLRVGGEVRVVMRNPHEDVEYGGGGRYTEIDPPDRLAFTWIWDDNDTRQLIELDFEEADGVTTVRFTHSDLWDEEAVRSHEDGWSKAFDNLERTLAEVALARGRARGDRLERLGLGRAVAPPGAAAVLHLDRLPEGVDDRGSAARAMAEAAGLDEDDVADLAQLLDLDPVVGHRLEDLVPPAPQPVVAPVAALHLHEPGFDGDVTVHHAPEGVPVAAIEHVVDAAYLLDRLLGHPARSIA